MAVKDTKYDILLDGIEKDFDKLRERTKKKVRSFFKKEIIKLGIPCIRTQHSMYRLDGGDDYEKAFELLVDFSNHLSDNYRIGIYFNFEDGKFKYY